jgi:DNA-binding beta-propeller fold protein YncE
MRIWLPLWLVLLAVACTGASAAPGKLRATVSPSPSTLPTRAWTPTITLRDHGKPASARLALTISKGNVRRSFRPRATRRGTYRVRVAFPADGRWRWVLAARRSTLASGRISVSTRVAFELPYDLAVVPDGTILFPDRSRVLALSAGRVRVHATTTSQELIGMERLADGTLFVTDFPGNRILRLDQAGRESVVATVLAPADLVADEAGTTLWVASIADGVGVVRVDVASGRVEPFANVFQPHGIDRDQAGDIYAHDGRAVSRIDGETGAVSPFSDVDAFKLLVAPDGSVYGVEGSPAGGRVVRIAPDGSFTAVAGNGRLGPHADGPALEAGILPSAVAFATDGALLVSQVDPVPAIRRVDLATGQMTTLARGR